MVRSSEVNEALGKINVVQPNSYNLFQVYSTLTTEKLKTEFINHLNNDQNIYNKDNGTQAYQNTLGALSDNPVNMERVKENVIKDMIDKAASNAGVSNSTQKIHDHLAPTLQEIPLETLISIKPGNNTLEKLTYSLEKRKSWFKESHISSRNIKKTKKELEPYNSISRRPIVELISNYASKMINNPFGKTLKVKKQRTK